MSNFRSFGQRGTSKLANTTGRGKLMPRYLTYKGVKHKGLLAGGRPTTQLLGFSKAGAADLTRRYKSNGRSAVYRHAGNHAYVVYVAPLL